MQALTMRASRRAAALAATLAATMALTAVGTDAAEARERSSYRSSGNFASAQWIQVDDVPVGQNPTVGNVHRGWLDVEPSGKDRADVWGWIEDFDCEPGELPGHGGHGFEEEEPSGCVHVGERWIDGYDVSFTMDKKLSSARLSAPAGVITVAGGHGDGDFFAQPPVDMVWNGVGDVRRSSWRETEKVGRTTYTYSYSSTSREATMSGRFGPMGFDPALSGGQFGSRTVSSKSSTK
ncbi:hypothetical protein [Egicoccus halophilus]|uniref:Uncharacterized protein n=1 Tax=Egicoccus halophilus TaxID=1670830 RepID=A0A8J3AA44_9ACTN|nr:hypothetical protein [Egicoccus halophilus]GGI06107.1 hypothetical protein GCM10011354_17450 [Egicoccus halophilus]